MTAAGLALRSSPSSAWAPWSASRSGCVVSTIIRHIDDPMIEITLTTIAAYGSFVAAEHFTVPGVIATVAAGMLCGNYGARTGMSPRRASRPRPSGNTSPSRSTRRLSADRLRSPVRNLLASWLPIIVAYLIVTLARASSSRWWRLVGLTRERVPWSLERGAHLGRTARRLPMVLALGLPDNFPTAS